jgi:1,2-dihydroxy-3-keto-5-methylthiopentene dioxygenase
MSTSPDAKKPKMSMPMSPDEEWPDAWRIPDEVTEQKKENRLEPNEPVTPADLKKIGIAYWKMDAETFTYPEVAVPWDPKDAMDPRLKQLRDERGYSYADIITITKEKLPEFDKKIKAFFEEHIHDAEEIRFIIGGSGYFDVRDKKDKWVRVNVKKGDLMTLPEGIYHRFTCDESNTIHAMRLFIGQPIWTPFNRPDADTHPSRQVFVKEYLEEKKDNEE